MKNLLELLRRKAPPKATELRAALAALPSDTTSAEAIAALEAERRAALLDGLVDDDVVKIERRIADAVRERDRTNAFREELAGRLEQAEKIEAIDALAERKLRAEVESRDIAKRFQRYAELVDELVAMLRDDRANIGECAEVDRQLHEIGTTDRCARATRPSFGVSEGVLLQLGGAEPLPAAS